MTSLTPPPATSAGSSTAIERPAVGVAYHRLGRTPAHRWWSPLLGSALIVALASFGFTAIFVTVLALGAATSNPEGWFADPLVFEIVHYAGLATLIPAVCLAAQWVQQRPAGTVSSVAGRLRWRWLARCLLAAAPAAALMIALDLGIEWAISPNGSAEIATSWEGWPRFVIASIVIITIVPLQAAGEEYLCRGWILQMFGAWLRSPWVGIVISGATFSLLHGIGHPGGGLELALFGMVTAWLTVRTGGLEAAIALHAMYNVVVLTLLLAVTGGLGGSAADAPWSALVASAIVLPLYVWYVRRQARLTQLVTTASPS